MVLGDYGVTSYGVSEELTSMYKIVHKYVRTCEIIYAKDMAMQIHKAAVYRVSLTLLEVAP